MRPETKNFLGIIALMGFLFVVINLSEIVPKEYWGSSKDKKDQAEGNTATSTMIGGAPFEMVNHLGETVKNTDFHGKKALYYFGFTHCPDICPAGLQNISIILDNLGEKAREKIQTIFVSVDAKRDTPEQMKLYLENFDSSIIGLTGSQEQIDVITKSFHIYVKEVMMEGIKGPMYSHSGYIYFMDEKGQYLGHFPYNDEINDVTEIIRSHL